MRFRYVALGLLLSASVVFAGAGPPPFSNGSPLSTGIDGTYALIAKGRNLSGVVEFSIANGVQSNGVSGWAIFIDGQVLRGDTSVVISAGSVQGILFGSGTSIPTNPNGSATLPIAFIVPGNAASGEFNGSLDQNSPEGMITGKGLLSGAPPRVDQLIVISNTVLIFGTVVTKTDILVPGSSIKSTSFTIRGTRQSTTSLAAATPTPSS